MTNEEAKHLSIEFINRAYELFELVEKHPKDFPEETRYLSHGFYLKLSKPSSLYHCTILLIKKNSYTNVIVYELNVINRYISQLYTDITNALKIYIENIVIMERKYN